MKPQLKLTTNSAHVPCAMDEDLYRFVTMATKHLV